MSREPRTERHLNLAWADKLAGAINAEMRHEACALHDPGTESLLGQVFAAPAVCKPSHHTGHPATPLEPAMPPPLPHMHTRPAGHHLPAALTQPGDLPPPIPFPAARPANARAVEPSESTRQRWARMGKLVDTAKAEGHAAGVQQGYTQGWRWGLWCGGVCGALLASLAWAVWLTATAPSAAPPSATQSHLSNRG